MTQLCIQIELAMLKISAVFVFAFFFSLSVFAQQDSIVLLNGKVYRGTFNSVENDLLFYTGKEKKKDGLLVEISTERIFSYSVNGTETVLYVHDELKGDYLTVDEVRFTTLGSYDARKTFKPRFVFWSSMALGLGVSIVDTYYSQVSYDKFLKENAGLPPSNSKVGFFGTGPSLMPVFVPLILSATWGLPTFKIKSHQILQKDLYGNEFYYRGYHRIAKQKRIFAAVKGSVIGIGLGIISYSILRIN